MKIYTPKLPNLMTKLLYHGFLRIQHKTPSKPLLTRTNIIKPRLCITKNYLSPRNSKQRVPKCSSSVTKFLNIDRELIYQE